MFIDTSAVLAILLNEPERREPLLYKGEDFRHTDIPSFPSIGE